MPNDKAKIETFQRLLEIKAQVLQERIASYEAEETPEVFQFLLHEKRSKLDKVNEILIEYNKLFGLKGE